MSQTPKFEEQGDATVLCCPNCSSNYLHHTHIDIFERQEDARNGKFISITGGNITTIDSEHPLTGNPNSRRDGVAIYFECECGTKSKLTIAQHKGQTLIEHYQV